MCNITTRIAVCSIDFNVSFIWAVACPLAFAAKLSWKKINRFLFYTYLQQNRHIAFIELSYWFLAALIRSFKISSTNPTATSTALTESKVMNTMAQTMMSIPHIQKRRNEYCRKCRNECWLNKHVLARFQWIYLNSTTSFSTKMCSFISTLCTCVTTGCIKNKHAWAVSENV